MTTKPDSPAFPEDRGLDSIYSGLTIREYMATQIMAGLVANLSIISTVAVTGQPDKGSGMISVSAVELADALIAALNQTPAAPDRKDG